MNEQVRSEVLSRWYGSQSMRRIARDLHLSRKTVSRIIAEHQQQRTTGTTGLPAPRGFSGRTRSGRPLRGVFDEFRGTHPGRASPAQDVLRPPGGRRIISLERTAVRRSHAAAPGDGVSTTLVRAV